MRTGQLLGLHRLAPVARRCARAGRAAPTVASPSAWRVRRTRRAGDRRAGRAVPRLRRPPDVLGRVARGLRHARDGGLPRHDAARAGVLRRAARPQRRSRRRAQAGRLDGALVRRQRGPDRHDRGRLRRVHGRLRHAARDARGARTSARACATTRRCSPGATLPTVARRRPIRVAYQDSCHLRNGQKVVLEPRALLASLPGVEVVDLPSAGRCCGAAGTYALMRPDDSLRFLDVKLARDRRGGRRRHRQRQSRAASCSSARACSERSCDGVRVLHTAELVAERLQR